jgi:hypothetical protein
VALQGFARACKSPISKRFPLPRLTTCCRALRSRWCQSGVRWCRPSIALFARGGEIPPFGKTGMSESDGGTLADGKRNSTPTFRVSGPLWNGGRVVREPEDAIFDVDGYRLIRPYRTVQAQLQYGCNKCSPLFTLVTSRTSGCFTQVSQTYRFTLGSLGISTQRHRLPILTPTTP